MRLYIVRHAAAGEFDPLADDRLRELTPGGRERFTGCLCQLTSREFAPRRIASSPLVRCRQTAELLADQLDPRPEIELLDALSPGSNLAELIAWSNEQAAGDDVAWVGHMPDVSHLAVELLGASGLHVRFRKGAILAIEFRDRIAHRRGELMWFVVPKLLSAGE